MSARIYKFPKQFKNKSFSLKEDEKFGPEAIQNYIDDFTKVTMDAVMEKFRQHSILGSEATRAAHVRDMQLIIESIRSAAFRMFSQEHSMQKMADEIFGYSKETA